MGSERRPLPERLRGRPAMALPRVRASSKPRDGHRIDAPDGAGPCASLSEGRAKAPLDVQLGDEGAVTGSDRRAVDEVDEDDVELWSA